MKYILSFFLIASIFSSCADSNSQTQKGIIISGTVLNPGSGQITFEKMMHDHTLPIDTILLNDDNTYTYEFTGEAGFYRINFYSVQGATIIVDQDNLIIDFDGSNTTSNIKTEGSREIDMIEGFYLAVKTEFEPKEQAINESFVAANAAGDLDKANQAKEDYMALQETKQNFSANLIRGYELNLGVFQLATSLNNDTNLALKDSLAQALNKKYPGRFYIEALVAGLDKARATAVGVLAPEISLPNPDGVTVTLSSLRGQVVLVDFWAQWCKPCRLENPHVVKAFQKYKDNGFTVYGVSLDKTKEKWVQAIEEDNLTWTHVSDLKYFQSEAAQAYGINSIPFSILLDREGKIIAKNLRGNALEKALANYFEKEGGM